jgi:NAD(P)-dependent dehydrogenase (short-subunit alcohol dehydrogenase family)
VTSPADVSRVAERIERESGRLDVLVNNAGTLLGGITEALAVEQLSSQLDTNVIGPFRLMRALLPLMRRQRSGLVVNVSSIAGRMVFPFFGAYCASKWALDALSESMRYELASQGVDVAIVEPGFFHTQLFAHATTSADIARGNEYGPTAVIPGQLLASFDQLFAQQPAETAPQVLVDAIVALIDTAPGSPATAHLRRDRHGRPGIERRHEGYWTEYVGRAGTSALTGRSHGGDSTSVILSG